MIIVNRVRNENYYWYLNDRKIYLLWLIDLDRVRVALLYLQLSCLLLESFISIGSLKIDDLFFIPVLGFFHFTFRFHI